MASGNSCTFRNYFEITYEPDDILAEFDSSLRRTNLVLPRANLALEPLTVLKNSIERALR